MIHNRKERNNKAKEEEVRFGTEEGVEVKGLRSWMTVAANVTLKTKRAQGLW